MITWAGRILVFLGALHSSLALALSSRYFSDWMSLRLWIDDWDVRALPPAVGAFMFGPGSFGLPLVLVGLLVIWMDRRGITPPDFLAWTLLVWTVLCTVVTPAPWVLAGIAAVLLLLGARRSTSARSTSARSGGATEAYERSRRQSR